MRSINKSMVCFAAPEIDKNQALIAGEECRHLEND
jgi:hypothetical protein